VSPDRTPGPRRARPAFLIAGLAALAVLAALLTPEPTESAGNGGLTTYSSALNGAQLTYDLARHLGWRVARGERALTTSPPPDVIQVLLDPSELVSAAEAHLRLEGVRAGGALLIAGRVPNLDDSLHLGSSEGRVGLLARPSMSPACGRLLREMPLASELASANLEPKVLWTAPAPSTPIVLASLRSRDEEDDLQPGDVFRVIAHGGSLDTMLNARRRDNTRNPARARPPEPAAVGFAYGAGRIVFIPGADMFENLVLRSCVSATDVVWARALEYLSEGSVHRNLVVFDEYHHGYGTHPSMSRGVFLFVSSTTVGRALTEVLVAGLVLLVAAGPRPVVPRDPVRAVRRSPLEQADALANAYETVHGTQTVAARLLAGVRRRSRGSFAWRTLDDDAFLAAVTSQHPGIDADTALVRRALHVPIDDKDLPALAAALRRIEARLTGSSLTPHPAP